MDNMPTAITPDEPILAFFQETKNGDLLKQVARSNVSTTGGGARDLRIRPATPYWERLAQFFPHAVSNRERTGIIYTELNPTIQNETISLWDETAARPGEIRIATIHLIAGWQIDQHMFNNETNQGYLIFYLLTLDKSRNVWARVMSTRHLNQNRADFVGFVKMVIQAKTSEKETARGIFDFSNGQHYR